MTVMIIICSYVLCYAAWYSLKIDVCISLCQPPFNHNAKRDPHEMSLVPTFYREGTGYCYFPPDKA